MKKTIIALFLFSSTISFSQINLCQNPHVHDFDFWLGKWDVYNLANNQLVGDSYIQTINDSCAIQEHYSNQKANYAGTSINKYNFENKQWEQYWVDNGGLTLHLIGNLQGKNMVLEGASVQTNTTVLDGQEIKTTLNKITWHNNADGTVRQHWQTSNDNGKTWQTSFDGLYKRKK